MALTLQEMRDFIRTHLDLEVEDLPDTLIDRWLREGSKRIERAEVRWPYFEKFYTWVVAFNPFLLFPKTTIGADIDQIASITHSTLAFPNLIWVGPEAWQELTASRPSATGRPIYFSEWQGSILLYPNPDTSYTLRVFGFRKAIDWVAAGAGATPDLPDELHNTVMTWGLAKAYAQQEDPEMASFFERQFLDEVKEMTRRLVITPLHQPLVLNSGHVRRNPMLAPQSGLRFDWEVT